MAKHLCPSRTTTFHLWEDKRPQPDPQAVPDLLLCPDHDREEPRPISFTDAEQVSAALQAYDREKAEKALKHGENYSDGRDGDFAKRVLRAAESLTSAQASSFAKALWADLHDTLTNERAWAIIDVYLKAAEERGAGRERLRLALPPKPDERGV